MPAIPIQPKHRYIRYTGSNSAELNAEVGMTIISETNGVLVAQIPTDGQQYTINTNQYVIYYENAVAELNDDNEFARRWRCSPTCPELSALADRVAALENAAGSSRSG